MAGAMTLPTFLVLGAQRAGTTWLDRELRSHPQVYLPTRRKEVHFFDRYHDRGATWYRSFFPPENAAHDFRAIGEITPRYLFDPEAPARIHTMLPNARFVAILRDPVERAYSQYGLAVRDAAEHRPFAEYLKVNPEILERGFYSQQLERYRALFPSDRLLVLIFERAVPDPSNARRQLAEFLEIDPAGFTSGPALVANPSYRPRFPRLRAMAVRSSDRLQAMDLDLCVSTLR